MRVAIFDLCIEWNVHVLLLRRNLIFFEDIIPKFISVSKKQYDFVQKRRSRDKFILIKYDIKINPYANLFCGMQLKVAIRVTQITYISILSIVRCALTISASVVNMNYMF